MARRRRIAAATIGRVVGLAVGALEVDIGRLRKKVLGNKLLGMVEFVAEVNLELDRRLRERERRLIDRAGPPGVLGDGRRSGEREDGCGRSQSERG